MKFRKGSRADYYIEMENKNRLRSCSVLECNNKSNTIKFIGDFCIICYKVRKEFIKND